MIKKLLGSLAMILLFFGCGGGDGIDYGDLDSGSGGLIGNDTYVVLSDVCSEDPNQLTTIVITCRLLEGLDYKNNPPEVCDKITIFDKNGGAHTGLYHSFHKGDGCNL